MSGWIKDTVDLIKNISENESKGILLFDAIQEKKNEIIIIKNKCISIQGYNEKILLEGAKYYIEMKEETKKIIDEENTVKQFIFIVIFIYTDLCDKLSKTEDNMKKAMTICMLMPQLYNVLKEYEELLNKEKEIR